MPHRVMILLFFIALALGFAGTAGAQEYETTLYLKLRCEPAVLDLPGPLRFEIWAENLMDHPRVYKGFIDLHLSNGDIYYRWRERYGVTIDGYGVEFISFTLDIPAYRAMIGTHRFKCKGVDVTPPEMDHGIPGGYHVWSECLVEMTHSK